MAARPGEITPAPRGRFTLYLTVGIWQEGPRAIHVTLPGWPGFHVAITPRNHPRLFQLLAQVLHRHGRWPHAEVA